MIAPGEQIADLQLGRSSEALSMLKRHPVGCPRIAATPIAIDELDAGAAEPRAAGGRRPLETALRAQSARRARALAAQYLATDCPTADAYLCSVLSRRISSAVSSECQRSTIRTTRSPPV